MTMTEPTTKPFDTRQFTIDYDALRLRVLADVTQRFEPRIVAELERLTKLSSPQDKREATLRAVARAVATGESVQSVVGAKARGLVVGSRIYYHADKDYFANALFRDVLEKVTAVYREMDAALLAEVEAARGIERHVRRTAVLDSGYRQLGRLIEHMGVYNQSPAQVATFMKTIIEKEREEFGGAGSRTDVTSKDQSVTGIRIIEVMTAGDDGVNDDDE